MSLKGTLTIERIKDVVGEIMGSCKNLKYEILNKIMRGVIRFKPGLSDEYKNLVNAILKYETAERIPLIKVFDHPWVRNFEK